MGIPGRIGVVLAWLMAALPAPAQPSSSPVTIVELEEPVEDKDKERIGRVVETMLAFHSRYADMPGNIELKIRLFRTEHHLKQHYYKDYPNSRRRQPPTAYYSPQTQEMVVHQQAFRWVQIMIHEVAHRLNDIASPRLPTWLEEGLAVFFESGYPRGSRVVFRAKRHDLAEAVRAQRIGHLPPLRQFMETSYRDFHRITENTNGARTYSVAYALVYFMMSDQERRDVLVKIMSRLRAGEKNVADIFEQEYPGGLSRLQYDWYSFLRKPFSDVIFAEDGFTR